MRLSTATLRQIPSSVERFAYDRGAQAVGIVHLGIGAFHRAHQAWYTDRAMDGGDRDWAIAGVSLRSADVGAQLNPQDGLYSIAERSSAGVKLRVVGAVRDVTLVHHDRRRVADLLAAPRTRIVSLTVTEKGYCRTSDGSLDPTAHGEATIYSLLAGGLAERQAAGLDGLTLLSCDNLADNGPQLERLLGEYLALNDPLLAEWVARKCTFPSTMVDRIVPATTEDDRAEVERMLGVRDEAAVVTEPFAQWVIEDRFANDRPRWQLVGAQLVADVAPYETAKLRMLNGAHSALAYLGLERGHLFVHQAIADPSLRQLVERLMRDEAATSFTPAPGQDLASYAEALLARFANPALNHRLTQIAMDGSQKIPQRWLATLEAQRERGLACPSLLAALSAWLRYVRGDRGPISDPLAEKLQAVWRGQDTATVARKLFAADGLFGGKWHPQPVDLEILAAG